MSSSSSLKQIHHQHRRCRQRRIVSEHNNQRFDPVVGEQKVAESEIFAAVVPNNNNFISVATHVIPMDFGDDTSSTCSRVMVASNDGKMQCEEKNLKKRKLNSQENKSQTVLGSSPCTMSPSPSRSLSERNGKDSIQGTLVPISMNASCDGNTKRDCIKTNAVQLLYDIHAIHNVRRLTLNIGTSIVMDQVLAVNKRLESAQKQQKQQHNELPVDKHQHNHDQDQLQHQSNSNNGNTNNGWMISDQERVTLLQEATRMKRISVLFREIDSLYNELIHEVSVATMATKRNGTTTTQP